MDSLIQDFRYALRTLLRSPGFTIAAVLTLALGIGANTAIFSVVDGVLLRPSVFRDMNRLVMVWETDRSSGTTREPASVPDYVDFQQRSRQLERIAAISPIEVNHTAPDAEPRRMAALGVSKEFLATVGVNPITGRGFTAEEDRANGPQAVLISEDLWESAYARSPDAVGKTMRLNDAEWPIVGVLPRGTDFGTLQILSAAAYNRGFAERGGRVKLDLWLPLRADPNSLPRSTHPVILIGRLAQGATSATAQQEMAAIAADLERQYPVNVARGANIEPLSGVVFGRVRPALAVLLGAVALVLLVACANVANLMLVRGAGRIREVTVRAALGAGMRRLARQFLVEGLVLTAAGATLGITIATVGLEALLRMAPGDIPRVDSIGLDGRVLAVTLVVSAIVGLSFGLLPTLQAWRTNLQPTLQGASGRGGSAGPGQGRFRSALVVTELALAVMLMAGAGLLIRSLWRLEAVNPGFRAAGVLKAEFQLPTSRYPRVGSKWPHWEEVARFNTELARRVSQFPGVGAVAISSVQPMAAGFTSSVVVVGREAEAANWPEPSVRPVSAGYFETMGVPVVSGRSFAESDNADAPPVAVINHAAVERFFGALPPLGQQVRMWGAQRTIVGIIGNERFKGLGEATPPALYYPLAQAPSFAGSYTLLVRYAGEPTAIVPSVRAAVREQDPALPLFAVEPLTQTISDSLGQRRFTMVVLGVFAAMALVLSIVGVHGVLSYAVSQRQREIGIRMALGADVPTVRGMVMRQGSLLAGAGLAIGLAGALALTRLLSALLYGVGATDPVTFAGVALLLGSAALVATYLPARRATLVDPTTALRAE